MANRHRPGPDGPRFSPAAGGLFAPAPAPPRLDPRRLLPGWLDRAMAAPCTFCSAPLEWPGRWVDLPACPHCKQVPPLEELAARDQAMVDLSRTPETRPCEKCSKDVAFVVNVNTGRAGPIATKDTVYCVFLPAVATAAGVTFRAMTAKDLSASGGRIVFPDGREIPLADVVFHVSHYATCPSASYFSKNGGMRP